LFNIYKKHRNGIEQDIKRRGGEVVAIAIIAAGSGNEVAKALIFFKIIRRGTCLNKNFFVILHSQIFSS